MLDTGYAYNTTEETMEVLQIKKRGQLLTTLKCFHIYDLSRKELQMNDIFADVHNPIFDLIIKYTTTYLQNPLPRHNPTLPPTVQNYPLPPKHHMT
jgi:hypothetical protein